MGYQNIGGSPPRFYINHLSKGINPATITGYGSDFPPSSDSITYSFDLKPNYVMLLGIYPDVTITDDEGVLAEKINYYSEGFGLGGYALMDYPSALTDGTLNVYGRISELMVGRYYDMPTNPDLKITLDHSYDGIKTITTKGGSTLSSVNYDKPAKWADGNIEAWQLGDWPYYYSGRRTWSLSWSYVSDTDIEPYSYYGNIWDSDTSATPTSSEGGDNWFQNVLYYTQGLPFVFCPDPSIEYYYEGNHPPRTPEFAICRFDMKSFKRTQISFKTYNIKVKIVESW